MFSFPPSAISQKYAHQFPSEVDPTDYSGCKLLANTFDTYPQVRLH